MLKADEDALICDLAETYHIYDWRSYSVRFIATLACGLPDTSRIKLKITGQRVGIDTQILARIADAVIWLAWSRTRDAQRGFNRPPSIYSALMGSETEEESFGSPEEFEAARAKILGR